jgi:hypothetical protein
LAASTWATSAIATAPVTASPMLAPEKYSAPPTEICTIPSLSASVNPRSAALSVWVDVTFTAG